MNAQLATNDAPLMDLSITAKFVLALSEPQLMSWVLIIASFGFVWWIIKLKKDITQCRKEVEKVNVVLDAAGGELNAKRVIEILSHATQLSITGQLWKNLINEVVFQNYQNPKAKVQCGITLDKVFSAKNIVFKTKSCFGLLMTPVIQFISLAAVALVILLLGGYAAVIELSVSPSIIQKTLAAAAAIVATASLILISQCVLAVGAYHAVKKDFKEIIQRLNDFFEVVSDASRTIQLQKDITRLCVQVSVIEATVANFNQSSYRAEKVATNTSIHRHPALVSAGAVNMNNKKLLMEKAASSVRDVISLIDMAHDAISHDLESTYRKLMNKYGSDKSKNNASPVGVVRGNVETSVKVRDNAMTTWRQWNACNKTRPAFEGLDQFLESAENCLITLANLKNGIVEMGVSHSAELASTNSASDINKFTNNYILLGDIMSEIRNSIGKIAGNNQDVTESWRNLQGQIEGLNRVGRDKLVPARGIVSGCFKTVSSQMSQIQMDLNNHLHVMSTTLSQGS